MQMDLKPSVVNEADKAVSSLHGLSFGTCQTRLAVPFQLHSSKHK